MIRRPTFVYQITIGDLLSFLAILLACAGLFLNLLQMQADSRQSRAQYIIDLSNQSSSDKDIEDIYYKIEYEEFVYDEDFHESEDERKLDKLLGVYENMAKLYKLKNITIEDLDYVAYSYLVVYQDDAVRDYLTYLDEWYVSRGVTVRPYSDFREVGKILEQKYFEAFE